MRRLTPRLLATFLLCTAPPVLPAQTTLQLPEDGVRVRALPAGAAPARLCVPGARWIRVGFADLVLRGDDRLALTGSAGDRLVLAGPHWAGRRFHVRALRGSCVDVAADFRDPASRYRVAGYEAGAVPLEATTVTVAGAGDICNPAAPANCMKTADLVVAINPTVALAFGDNAYTSGTLAEYTSTYDPAWGRFKALTAPVPGNHEYRTSGASGYFDYFNGVGVQAGPAGDRSRGWYSYDVGDWHFIALNSRSGSTVSSAQLAWLDADLHANTKPCTAAYFHHPFVSVGRYTGYATLKPIVDRLYASRADLMLVGHDHGYQRFAPMDGHQAAQADGLREVVVGTGGATLYPITRSHPLLEKSQGTTYGVLRLDLTPGAYSARFVPVAGQTWTDSFGATCHRAVAVVGDFLLGASASIAIPRAQAGSKMITVTSYGAFNAPVDLSVAGLPAGVSATFSVDPVKPPADGAVTSRLTLRVAAGAVTGTYPLSVRGTSGAFTRSAPVDLIVK